MDLICLACCYHKIKYHIYNNLIIEYLRNIRHTADLLTEPEDCHLLFNPNAELYRQLFESHLSASLTEEHSRDLEVGWNKGQQSLSNREPRKRVLKLAFSCHIRLHIPSECPALLGLTKAVQSLIFQVLGIGQGKWNISASMCQTHHTVADYWGFPFFLTEWGFLNDALLCYCLKPCFADCIYYWMDDSLFTTWTL